MSASDVVVTGHQLNFLPGCSVIERIRRADIVIWLDAAQYVRHSFVNRNRLTDGAWMTIPVDEHDTYAPINRVRIADPSGRAREKIARKLEHAYGSQATPFARELRRRYQLLAGLNYALIQHLLQALDIHVEQHFQSMLDPLHAVPVWSEDDDPMQPVRDRYADWAAQLGGTVWLSGPSRHFGAEEAYAERGIRIETYHHDGPNPAAIELLRQ
jgi:WbqC-like protein family